MRAVWRGDEWTVDLVMLARRWAQWWLLTLLRTFVRAGAIRVLCLVLHSSMRSLHFLVLWCLDFLASTVLFRFNAHIWVVLVSVLLLFFGSISLLLFCVGNRESPQEITILVVFWLCCGWHSHGTWAHVTQRRGTITLPKLCLVPRLYILFDSFLLGDWCALNFELKGVHLATKEM